MAIFVITVEVFVNMHQCSFGVLYLAQSKGDCHFSLKSFIHVLFYSNRSVGYAASMEKSPPFPRKQVHSPDGLMARPLAK